MTDHTPKGPDRDSRVVFLAVPESLRGPVEAMTGHDHDYGHDPDDAPKHRHDPEEEGSGAGSFSIDPAIPLPVELDPETAELDLQNLSGEMILSGMLRILAEDPNRENADYYRRFVLALRPGILGEFTEAAIIKAKNGDYTIALEIIDALNGLFPRSPVVLLNRALILESRAEAPERTVREEAAEEEKALVLRAYEEVLALDPPFPDALFNAGFFYMKQQRFEQAKNCFTRYILLADESEKRDQAERILEEIERNSLDDGIFREAYDLIRLGEEQRGLLKIRDFLEHHPDVRNGWFVLGWGLRRLGRWEDGAAAFKKAIELGENSADILNELAICLMELGDYDEARRRLETALRKDPENVKIISNLGVLASKTGDDDLAAGFFRTVLELDPEDPVARLYLENSRD
jgi:tetratricopeptide (TPR) repeat protein